MMQTNMNTTRNSGNRMTCLESLQLLNIYKGKNACVVMHDANMYKFEQECVKKRMMNMVFPWLMKRALAVEKQMDEAKSLPVETVYLDGHFPVTCRLYKKFRPRLTREQRARVEKVLKKYGCSFE